MFYAILGINLAVLVVVVVMVVRWFRSPPEKRIEMLRPKKKTILMVVGASVVGFVLIGAVIFSFFGVTGIRVTGAAKDYLREQYGVRDSWEIELSDHVEHSKKPEAGIYQLHYRYGEKTGFLIAE